MSEVKKSSSTGKAIGIGCLAILGVLVSLTVLGAIVGDDKDASKPVTATSSEKAVAVAGAVEQSIMEAQAPKTAPEPSLTGPQSNAARSASQYLATSGFSREGLIQQLSSDAGDGYAVADATAAVDSLDIDWSAQAVKSAKQYLQISGFSCKGLIQQLSSDAGDRYTKSEATYGAEQAGAC